MYLKECWYALSLSREIVDAPLRRLIMGKPLVLFRNDSGAVCALDDMCPHRLFPLSKGKIVEHGIQCGYHGLVVSGEGVCVDAPGQDTAPNTRVTTYPVHEEYGLVWGWMGDPAKADKNLVPDLHEQTDDSWTSTGDYKHIASDYWLMVENLIDLSHVHFVHQSSLGVEASAHEYEVEVERQDDRVVVERWSENVDPPAVLRLRGVTTKCDRWEIIEYLPPSTVRIDTGGMETGKGARQDHSGHSAMTLFTMTPETETAHHFFWSIDRDWGLNSGKFSQMQGKCVRAAFGEDQEVLEAQQVNMGLLGGNSPINLAGDKGGLFARRILDRLIEAQNKI